ncbi:hypothetical protein [Silvibacterium sp.]|uniref:hypothetical protein n=1 Tax=Silvibacterium sp. TaxID=1964179 RepID=UPI0039E3AFAF
MNVRTSSISLFAVAMLSLAAGCTDTKPSNAKFEKSLNAYFENHNECLFPSGMRFPDEEKTGPEAATLRKQLDAMSDIGLLKREDEHDIQMVKYTLTPLGQRTAPRFCYGHRMVTSIDGYTQPAKQNGFLESTVSYHYMMMDIPVWANTDKLKAVFPKMADSISGNASDKQVMATVGAGWQVPE